MNDLYTIGVDFGTLSGRAVIAAAADGREIAGSEMKYPHGVIDTVLPGTGEKLPADFALQYPGDYLEVLYNTVSDVMRKSGLSPVDVAGIGIDFTTCTVLPVYADGTPLCFTERFAGEKHAWCKLWKHHAAQPYADRINAAACGEKWMHSFGGIMSPECIYPKIWETLDAAPEVYENADYFIEAGDWLNWMMTGEQRRAYLFAAFKAGYRYGDGYPPADFFTGCDPGFSDLLTKKLNAPVIGTAECAGYLTEEAAEKLCLRAGIPVAAASPDSHVSAPALGVSSSGDSFGIFGTSSAYDTLTEEYHDIPGICGCVEDGLYPGLFCCVSGLCCVGDLFGWLSRTFADEKTLLEASGTGTDPLSVLVKKAAAKRPGETGLVALDWWNGNRSVLVRGDLSGLLVGMTLHTSPEDVLRALTEATAFATRVIFDAYRKSGVKTGRLVAAGGISRKEPFIMQLYADVLRMPISTVKTAQAPALGSAIMAAAAAGVYKDLAEAAEYMRSPETAVYLPDESASAVYDKLYSEYLLLHDYFGRNGNDVMPRLRTIAADGNK